MKIRKPRGTSIIEYSLIFAIVVAAIVGIQVYLARAVSGRWRQSADTFGYGRQYDAPEVKLWQKK